MRVTPAEPLWYVAAEFTLVFNKIGSMSFASLFTSTNSDGCTLTTDEFLFLEVGVIVTGLITCFSTTVIWLFAFETFIIGKGTHREFLQIVIVWVTDLFESWFFIQVFKFCSLHCFFDYHCFKFDTFLDFFIKRWALLSWHSLFTIWAIDVIENYTRSIVPILNNFLKAINMENMSASKLNTWFLSKGRAVTNGTVFIFVNIRFHITVHLGNTCIFKTWHALLFSSWSKTCMTTFQYFVARFLHGVEAFSFSADVSKRWFHTWRWLLEFFLTESALLSVCLPTHLTQVIWLVVATGTEVFLALMASNSIFCHMNSRILTYKIASFVFKSFLDFTWQ